MGFTKNKIPAAKAPYFNMARKVIAKFGGVYKMAKVMEQVSPDYRRNPSSIYRWLYPKPRGTGGLIPSSAWADVVKAARLAGVLLTEDDRRADMVPIPADHIPPRQQLREA